MNQNGCYGPARDQMLVENKSHTKRIPSGMKCYLAVDYLVSAEIISYI